MDKNVDLTKVNLSGKGIFYLLLGIAVVIVVWKVANWGIDRLASTVTGDNGIFGGVI